MKIIYTENTLNFISREKGIETANGIVKQGTVKTLDGVNYVLIE